MGQVDREIELEEQPTAVATPVKVMIPPGSSTTVAIPTASAQGTGGNIPMWQQEKQGGKCCGVCCDYRRAVIVIAIITLCINAATVVFTVAAVSYPGLSFDDDSKYDDQVIEIWDDGLRNQAIYAGISLVAAICALVGATKFNIYLVGCNMVWYIGGFIANTIVLIRAYDEINELDNDEDISPIATIIMNAILCGVFLYPHIGFVVEVQKGIMSAETYPREEFSCCCTASRR